MIQPIKRILFTTDLSEHSKNVFEMAVSLALQTNASITILHVIESGPSQPRNILVNLIGSEAYAKIKADNETFARNVLIGKQKEVPLIREALKKLSQDAFDKLEDEKKPVVIDDIDVRLGHIVDEILNIVDEKQIDMIVMGHHQKSMMLRAVIGSTVRCVLRQCKIPVHLVPIDL